MILAKVEIERQVIWRGYYGGKMQTTGQILGKAHKLCEWLRNANTRFTSYSAAPMAWAVERSIKWHIGNADDLPAINNRDALESIPLQLPAEDILIEFESGLLMADGRIMPMTGFLLCDQTKSGGIEFLAFGHSNDRFYFDGGGVILIEDGKRRFSVFSEFEDSKTSSREIQILGLILEKTLLALHCTNVRSVDNNPPQAINRKRQKAGKIPLFTYKTLHVVAGERGGLHSQGDDEDDARISPRLHFRRGHVRRIGDGRITWVQQCMVGNRRLGVVEKAYAFEAR